jgi:hypothetical protein
MQGPAATGVTYDQGGTNQAMTLVPSIDSTGLLAMYYIPNNTIFGAVTIRVTFPGSIQFFSFTAQAWTTPKASAGGGGISGTLTVDVGNFLFAGSLGSGLNSRTT